MLRLTITALLSTALLAAMPVRAADAVRMNLGWATPAESDYGVLADKFKELAAAYSGGTIDVRLRCCGQIGTEDDAFKALQLGTVDGYIITQNNVAPHWPLMNLFVLPYIFRDKAHLAAVAEGPVGDEIRRMIQEETGVHLLTFGAPAYRDVFNSRHAINGMADMSGLKLRVPNNRVMIATFRAFGAEPVPLAWSDTPTALQTGTIDGGDNGTTVIKDMKFHEFADHLTILEHFTSVSPLFASRRFMGRLSDDQRAAVLRAAEEAGRHQAAVMAQATDDVRAWLAADGGMAMTAPDRAPFIAAAETVQAEFAAEAEPRFQALLTQIRAVGTE